MIATWMVSLSGWLLALLLVLAVAGLVLVGLVIHDEVCLYRQRKAIRARAEQRRQERGTR